MMWKDSEAPILLTPLLLLSPAILLAMLFVLTSCEKDFVVKEQQQASRITINCLFDNLRVFQVYVTESASLSGNASIKPLTDARVELYENDLFLQVLPFVFTDTGNTFGSYQTNFFPTTGKKYTVKVIHNKYGMATAEDFLPPMPQISSYQLEHYGTRNEFNRVQFKIQFHDDAATTDYYRINIWMWGQRWQRTSLTDSILEEYTAGAKPELISEVSDTIRDDGYFLLFSDKNFNGTDKELKIWFNAIDSSLVEREYLVVELQHITPVHYEYFRTLSIYHGSNVNGEPVSVFGNIENGYGIFMGSTIYSNYVVVK